MKLNKDFFPSIYKHVSRQFLAWRSDFWFIGLAVALVFTVMLPMLAITIPAGNVGVEWRRFSNGTDTGPPHREGMVLIRPWNQIIFYDTRVQVNQDTVKTLSADGLSVEVELAWQYHLVPEAAGLVHKVLGQDYGKKIIGQVVTSIVRSQMAAYNSEDMHSAERLNFEKNVGIQASKALSELQAVRYLPEFIAIQNNWVVLENVLIKAVKFPDGVQEAYVRKNTARALVDEYTFKIAVEQKEVERKRTEALGIRGFQEIVNTGLSDSYLKWRGIDATLQLSQSNNAKVVVIGGGGNGMPLILNTNSDDAKNINSPVFQNNKTNSSTESNTKKNAKTNNK